MSITLIHYLAYGSNLHPFRLAQRVPLSRRQLNLTELGNWQWSWCKDNDLLLVPVFEIALAAAALLTDEKTKGRIKVCANGPCNWVFLDTSRNGQRRWCRMAVCGNISKVRRFRQRRRTAH